MSEKKAKDAAKAAPAPQAEGDKPKVSDTPVADAIIANTDRVHVRIPRY
ncbi:MAG: hypothetical protein LBR80_15235 [Deltaproteobacteria bacterium]|jgi:hypothetical protein|nr:hypothetical protein [Deltaproteobacteria bacterium]